ncbi:hypothetical protein ColLi_12220 [Colletotrichum liriopes]|uniref:Uncharacterized protein n=1 Tax=Colletotrichum liriopes TaxID=708192 RepID=A0AA37LZF0_9PEZI|nr:hypothetical protein ColLi_12220 [Colletotrichum liriopes]
MSDRPPSPGPAGGPGHNIRVSARRDDEIKRLITVLLAALNDTTVQEADMSQAFQDIHNRWWEVARAIHRGGQHHGVRAHVLDWPAFLRELYSADHLTQLLRIVYKKEWMAAKAKHSGKLVNAQKAMEVSETVELGLELGPEACQNNAAISGISSMRKPTNHAAIPANDIRRALLGQLVARVDADDEEDGGPLLSLAETKKAIKDLKDAAPAKPAAAKNLKRKRGSKSLAAATPPVAQGQGGGEGEEEEEEEEEEDQTEAPRAAKRVRVDRDLRESLADDYIHHLLDNGSSLLDEELSNPAADAVAEDANITADASSLTSTTTANASFGFGFGFTAHVTAGSLVSPARSRAAQLLASLDQADVSDADRQDTQAELDALLLEQHRQDELVREQLELLSRLRATGPAVVDGGLGAMMNPLLGAVARSADGILAD